MRHNFILLIIFLKACMIYGQFGDKSPYTVRLPTAIFFNDVFGKPFNPAANEDISGSPFINNNWKLAVIKLKDGRFFGDIAVKLNAYSQSLHYLSANGVELVAPGGVIEQVQINDTADNGTIIMRLYYCGMKAIENNDEKTFYEVLDTGKATLLLCKKVKIIEAKTFASTTIIKEYKSFHDYYISMNGTMNKCKKSDSFFTELFIDKKDLMQKFINENKIRFKSEKDFKTIVNYYNSL